MQGGGPALPLTMAQEPIWLEQLRHPDRVNAGFFFATIRGSVADEDVAEACAAVCRRHPELRGTVEERDQRYWFRINDVDDLFEFERASLPCPAGEEKDVARVWYLARRPLNWDLTSRGPIRFVLLDHGRDRRTLVVAVHHMAFDGRSKFVFARQLAQALSRLREHGGLAGAEWEPAAPLAGFEEPDPAALAAATDYWRSCDLPSYPSLVLPRPDGAPPAPGTAATPRFELPETAFRKLRAVTAEVGTTFFAGLLAATAAQLARYGNDRLALCIPADTSTEATRDRIAMQVNMVPCAIVLEPVATFRDLVAAAGQAVSTIDRFRRVPFHLLMRELRRGYGVDVGPGIFDRFGVSYPRVAADLGEVPGLRLDWEFFAPNSSQSFQNTLQLRTTPDGVFGRLDYTTSVFDAETAEDFAEDWCWTLEQALRDPNARVVPRFWGSTAAVAARMPEAASAVAPVPEAGAGTMVVPVERFLPTEDRLEHVKAGGRIVLVLDHERVGQVAWGEWQPDPGTSDAALPLPHLAGEWRPAVVARDGRELPRRTPGLLVLRPPGGGKEVPTGFRARIDGKGRLCFLGPADRAGDFGGRLLEGGQVERRIAALPGVRDVAVVPGEGAANPTPGVLVVPADTGASGSDPDGVRAWRRRVLRVWPPEAPRPTHVALADALPLDPSGAVNLPRVRAICRTGRPSTDSRPASPGTALPTEGRR
ncbi:condensation domain-containing protein [Streptomyces sp. NPDC002766]|uniref:condensation domain-containing protein n=1 Tax=Streptomyces sp. NPDC002766 TaxID=3154429 RepID=UPI003327B278